jgi:hypothetical protein
VAGEVLLESFEELFGLFGLIGFRQGAAAAGGGLYLVANCSPQRKKGTLLWFSWN